MTMHSVLRDAAKKVGIKKVGERTSLPRKVREKKGEGKTNFDEDLKGQVKNKGQERKDVWRVCAASPTGALSICRAQAERGAERSSTYCSETDREIGSQNVQEEVAVW